MKLFYVIATLIITSSLLEAAVTFDEKGLPQGTWRTSCQNARFDKNTKRLTAECKTSYEHFRKASDTNKYTTSSITLDDTDDIKDIQNHNGWLVAVLHEGGKHVMPEGTYKTACSGCEMLLTNDNVGNKVYCVRCTCTWKDDQGKQVQGQRLVCHPDLLTLQNPIEVVNGIITLNTQYLPQGEYQKTSKACTIDLEFHRTDAKGENGLQLRCSLPSTTGRYRDSYLRITDIREFLETQKNIKNTAGILTND